MSNNTPDYEDNLYFDSQNTKKDLCITVEKQVWESTLNRSMVLQAENEQLKKLLKECKELFVLEKGFMVKCIREETLSDIIAKINEVLK